MSSERTVLAQRYALERPFASGGMATVWRATDDVLQRTVAVKVLHPHLAADEAFLTRFRREARAAARLVHPNIVSIYDTGGGVGSDGLTHHFIVMEFCARGTLQETLAAEGPLPPQRTCEIGVAVAGPLAHAHRVGIVHRDVKPANVLLTEDGTLKVADFGIAKAAFQAGDITQTGTIIGTLGYLSPEQLRGDEPNPRSDLYSLGIVLYEALTGRVPLAADTPLETAMRHLRDEPSPPRTLRPEVPRPLDAVIMKALAKNPEHRFASAEEMKAALEELTTERVQVPAFSADTTEVWEPPEPSPTRWLLPVIFLIALAIALAAALPGLFQERDRNPGGDRRKQPERSRPLSVQAVSDFDPHGGGSEHPENAPLAADDSAATEWSTETYEDPLHLIKPGVGLVFDLGSPRALQRVEVVGSPGYTLELRAANTPGSTETTYEEIGAITAAPETARFQPGGAKARYWLVWITSLPGGSAGRATIAEVRFFGS